MPQRPERAALAGALLKAAPCAWQALRLTPVRRRTRSPCTRRNARSHVQVTADLSHWACVCERVFGNAACTDANGSDDEWWLPTLAEVGRRCALVHARVGFAEGPQVPDPSAPEYAGEVEAHMSWWAAIWNARAAAGDAVVLAEPEHGPAPYMWSLPHTRAPVADLWEVNSWVARQLKERFAMEELYE